jgi:AcrR family transcriptional regulator
MLDKVSSETTRNRIMDAAEAIVVQRGAAHLTFDEIARQSGFSKGGILYHFPTKKALLRDMVARMIGVFETIREQLAQDVEPTGLVGAKTYIMASFEKEDRYRQSSTALMAAAANDPELLDVVKEHYKRNFDEIRQTGKYASMAALLFLAIDGLWLLDALQLCTLDHDERQKLKELLLTMAGSNALPVKR